MRWDILKKFTLKLYFIVRNKEQIKDYWVFFSWYQVKYTSFDLKNSNYLVFLLLLCGIGFQTPSILLFAQKRVISYISVLTHFEQNHKTKNLHLHWFHLFSVIKLSVKVLTETVVKIYKVKTCASSRQSRAHFLINVEKRASL